MSELIDLKITRNTLNEITDALEKLCELSDDYFEIENYFCIIQNLNSQKSEHYAKVNEDLRKELKDK